MSRLLPTFATFCMLFILPTTSLYSRHETVISQTSLHNSISNTANTTIILNSTNLTNSTLPKNLVTNSTTNSTSNSTVITSTTTAPSNTSTNKTSSNYSAGNTTTVFSNSTVVTQLNAGSNVTSNGTLSGNISSHQNTTAANTNSINTTAVNKTVINTTAINATATINGTAIINGTATTNGTVFNSTGIKNITEVIHQINGTFSNSNSLNGTLNPPNQNSTKMNISSPSFAYFSAAPTTELPNPEQNLTVSGAKCLQKCKDLRGISCKRWTDDSITCCEFTGCQWPFYCRPESIIKVDGCVNKA